MTPRRFGVRRPAWLSRHWVLAAVLYAALSLLMVSPALVPGRTLSASDLLWRSTPWEADRPADVRKVGSNHELFDQVYVYQPFLRYTRATLPDLPLWNPHIMAGHPYIGNAQSAVFSPFSVPAYVLPFWRALAVIAALKMFVAAFGTYLLARALRIGLGGSLLAGVVFAFSLWFVAWLGWPMTSVWALMPWMWLGADRVVRRPDALGVAGLAAPTALQYFGGHPVSMLHVVAFTGLFFLLRLASIWRAGLEGLRPRAVRVGAFAVAMLLGTTLAALTLLPFDEALRQSAEAETRLELGRRGTTPPRYLLTMFLPDYWGRPTRTPIDHPFAPFLVEHQFYAGALTLMLAAAALVLRGGLVPVGVAALGALALATSVGAPPLDELAKVLPGFEVAQNSRLAVVYTLCLALLAGWGVHALAGRLPRGGRVLPRRRRTLVVVSTALLAVPVVWMASVGTLSLAPFSEALRIAWGFATPPRAAGNPPDLDSIAPQIRVASLLSWLLPAIAGLGLLALRATGRISSRPFVTLAVLLVVVDLFKAGVGFNPALSLRKAVPPKTPALTYLQGRRPARFVGVTPRDRSAQPVPANVGMRYGLYDTRGYDFPADRRYERLWRLNVSAPLCVLCTTSAVVTPRSLRVLSLLSVADLVQDPEDPPLRARGLELAYTGPDARIYANRRALPRAFVVDRQQVVDGEPAARAAVEAPRFRPRSVAVTEKELPGLRKELPGLRPGGLQRQSTAGTAELTRYDPEHIRVDASSAGVGLLVLTDVWYPGWKATVDGVPAPVHRVDFVLRGVPVSPGRHRVELRYEPESWRLGRTLSGAGLALLLAIWFVGWRSRRRSRPNSVRRST